MIKAVSVIDAQTKTPRGDFTPGLEEFAGFPPARSELEAFIIRRFGPGAYDVQIESSEGQILKDCVRTVPAQGRPRRGGIKQAQVDFGGADAEAEADAEDMAIELRREKARRVAADDRTQAAQRELLEFQGRALTERQSAVESVAAEAKARRRALEEEHDAERRKLRDEHDQDIRRRLQDCRDDYDRQLSALRGRLAEAEAEAAKWRAEAQAAADPAALPDPASEALQAAAFGFLERIARGPATSPTLPAPRKPASE